MEEGGVCLFFENRLIISYIYEANHQRYRFQLTGGEEKTVTREEFFAHLEIYRHYEARQAIKYEHEYRPLPVTVSIHKEVEYVCPL